MLRPTLAIVLGLGFSSSTLFATEPNNSFATATIITGPQQVMSRLDFATAAPDTTLLLRDAAGAPTLTDDDSSFFGNGRASALLDAPVNSDGSIRLAISGADDLDFDGLNDGATTPHQQAGAFEAYITIYNAAGLVQDEATRAGTLAPGQVLNYQLLDTAWIGGTFDIELNNFFGPPSDLDFWLFQSLPPGAQFRAEVTAGEFDAVLGWFDATGEFIDVDDDSGVAPLPRLLGTVPADGAVALAVSGYADFGFIGTHSEPGGYTLEITFVPEPSTALLTLAAGGGLLGVGLGRRRGFGRGE